MYTRIRLNHNEIDMFLLLIKHYLIFLLLINLVFSLVDLNHCRILISIVDICGFTSFVIYLYLTTTRNKYGTTYFKRKQDMRGTSNGV